MLALYKDVAILAAKRAAQSWLAAVSLPLYTLLVLLSMLATASLPPFIAGLIVGFVAAACFGAYLSLVAAALDGGNIRLGDLKNGLRSVWDVVGVFFVLSIIGLLVGKVQESAGPNAAAVGGVVALAAAILLNALPEVIYQRGATSLSALQQSVNFVFENAFAWFLPNIVFAIVILAATGVLRVSEPGELLIRLAQVGSVGGLVSLVVRAPYWMMPLLILFVHYAMVFRGLLFRELTGGSSRMRAFRRRMEG
jgi:hypothetical protein